MNPILLIGFLFCGGVIGIVGGMLGIGGGVLVIPALMMIFGFTYTRAIGTSLGMLLPPIGIFAFLTYYRAGAVDLRVAALLAVGFALGAWVGGWLVSRGSIPETLLTRLFAFFLLYVAGNMLFKSHGRAWAVLGALATSGTFAIVYFGMRLLGMHWERRWSIRELYIERRSRPTRPDYEI